MALIAGFVDRIALATILPFPVYGFRSFHSISGDITTIINSVDVPYFNTYGLCTTIGRRHFKAELELAGSNPTGEACRELGQPPVHRTAIAAKEADV
jgi:hypothetical protein